MKLGVRTATAAAAAGSTVLFHVCFRFWNNTAGMLSRREQLGQANQADAGTEQV